MGVFMKFIITMVGILISSSIAIASNHSPFVYDEMREEIKEMAQDGHNPYHSYEQARKYIMQQVHLRQDSNGYFVKDVYCKIKYRKKVAPDRMPDHRYLNIEHTWPKSRFGVKRGSSKYRVQVSDLHHLYPTDSRTNSRRGSYLFAQFKKDENVISECPFSKKGYVRAFGEDGFEPPTEHKGNVARSLFYFAVRYDLRISEHEEFILRQWNLMDPVDQEELARNDKIESIQGNRNPFVDDPDLSNLISDF